MTDLTFHHARLVNALTNYDRRQSGKKSYNPYALGHYMRAVGEVREALEGGSTLRQALLANFCGRLLDIALVACGEAKATLQEHRGR